MITQFSKILSVYTGNTFTDFVAYDYGKITPLKLNADEGTPEEMILKGIAHFQKQGFVPEILFLATNFTNNLIKNRQGVKTALITSQGFKDMIYIGRRTTQTLYTLNPEIPANILAREDVFEVDERILYNGTIEKTLNRKSARNLIKNIIAQGYESIAVSLINSPQNDQHERDLASILKKQPITYTISSEISGEHREYERTSTTLLNAYITPKLKQFVTTIQEALPPQCQLKIMQVNGGLSDATITAKNRGIKTLFSGQTGAVIGARNLSKRMKLSKIITFDMGASSTNVSIFDDQITLTSQMKIDQLPIRIPSVMIRTLGPGGSSLSQMNPEMPLKVYFEPVSQHEREILPSVIDATTHLGYLDQEHILKPSTIDPSQKINNYIKQQKLAVTADQYAEGVYEISGVKVARYLSNVATRRGYDPRDFTLIAMGGLGGIHAGSIAKELDISKIIIPKYAGLASAYGMLSAKTIKDSAKTVLKVIRPSKNHDFEYLKTELNKLTIEIKKELLAENVPESQVQIYHLVDMRYEGESEEITLPFSTDLINDFHKGHQKRYGSYLKNSLIEIITIRVRGIGLRKQILFDENQMVPESTVLNTVKEKELLFDGELYKTPCYIREQLPKHVYFDGPALIFEYGATTLVPPDFEATVDYLDNIILAKKG